ncbi:MAG: acyl-CoA reductase [Thermodesulfobacteriota bacterium]|nr:acyl-CoA reductase [Thermodesulfobacteriota bacterium]
MIPFPQHLDIHYLVGSASISAKPLEPYHPIVCEFLKELSSELKSSREASAYPDLVTFAFWCRASNIARLKAAFQDGMVRLGLGLAFHITPSNVPINFAFSYAFGLLSGNANVVRVPSKAFPQTAILCGAINRLLNDDKYAEIRAMTALVQYHRNSDITTSFSKYCNARIIWGGDDAIRKIRQFPVSERCVEMVFSDRYSFCVLDTRSVANLTDAKLKTLARRFYNDTYFMDQNACSSPRLVVWLGKDKEQAKKRFWQCVYEIVESHYSIGQVNVVDKYTQWCLDAISLDDLAVCRKSANYIYRLSLDQLPDNADTLRGTCGYFYEYDTDDINSLARIVNTRYQTMTYFGIDKPTLVAFVIGNRLKGIDRIVPIGAALDISVIWDGYDVVERLSRIVEVR